MIEESVVNLSRLQFAATAGLLAGASASAPDLPGSSCPVVSVVPTHRLQLRGQLRFRRSVRLRGFPFHPLRGTVVAGTLTRQPAG